MPLENADIAGLRSAYKLPANLVGAVIFVCFCSTRKSSALVVHYLVYLVPGLFCCMALQAVFIYYMADHTYGGQQTCQHGSMLLRLMCLLVLSWTVMVKDIGESIDVILFANQFPKYDSERDDDILEDGKTGFAYHMISKLGIGVTVTGITSLQFRGVVILVAFKLLIGCALLYLSAPYVAHADSNEDLLLNSVSMLFVADIDELTYLVLVPLSLKKAHEDLPAIVAHPDEWFESSSDRRSTLIRSNTKMLFQWWTGITLCGTLYWSWCR